MKYFKSIVIVACSVYLMTGCISVAGTEDASSGNKNLAEYGEVTYKMVDVTPHIILSDEGTDKRVTEAALECVNDKAGVVQGGPVKEYQESANSIIFPLGMGCTNVTFTLSEDSVSSKMYVYGGISEGPSEHASGAYCQSERDKYSNGVFSFIGHQLLIQNGMMYVIEHVTIRSTCLLPEIALADYDDNNCETGTRSSNGVTGTVTVSLEGDIAYITETISGSNGICTIKRNASAQNVTDETCAQELAFDECISASGYWDFNL